MGNLNTDSLMRLQVEQLEKEKKELNERLRIVAKRVDHIERAYRKEERPLLGRDYEQQQANDRATFEALQKARIEGAKISHQQDIETKKRLSRMMDDYRSRRDVIATKRGDDFAKRKEDASRKINEEKAKRRKAVLDERERERLRLEHEEKIRREKEEEEARLEAGMRLKFSPYHLNSRYFAERIAEDERIRAEEAAAAAAAEAAKREAEEKAAALRKEREEERAAAAEQARLRMQREEEAEKRREQRKAEERAAARNPVLTRASNGDAPAAWRRPSPANVTASVPSRAAVTPPRSESPGPPKYRPGALTGSGGWRDREAKKSGGAVAALNSRPASPAVAPKQLAKEEPSKDDDGFQTVPEKKVWKPRRLQS